MRSVVTGLEDEHRQLQPIHYAAKRGELELVAFLLQSGARIDASDGSYRLQSIDWPVMTQLSR